MTRRQLPQDPEAEAMVLSIMLASPDHVAELSEVVAPEDFYRPAHALICHATYNLHHDAEPITVASVASMTRQLDSRPYLDEAGGDAYLERLVAAAEHTSRPLRYARVVHELGVRRHLITFASAAKQRAHDLTDPIPNLLTKTAAELPTISTHPRRCSCRNRRQPS